MKKQELKFTNLNLLLIFILPVIFFSFGIKKQNELHEKLTIQGIGIDLDNDKYKVTVQAYDYKNPEDKNEPKIKILECTGETVSEALENLKSSTGLYPFYSQNKIIIFGSSLAKKGLKKSIDFFTRYYENRPSVKLRVAENEASEIIKSKVENKEIKASEMRDLVDEKFDINILKFEENIRSSISDSLLMSIEKSDNGLVCKQAAIFKDDKMIDILDSEEVLGIKILKNNPKVGIYTFLIDGQKVSCNLENSKCKIKSEINDGIPRFDINVKIDSNLFEDEKDTDRVGHIEKIRTDLNKSLEEICKNVIFKVVSKGCDLFNFGKILRNKFPRYFKDIELEWKDQIMANSDYDVKIDSKITMIGL